MKQAEETGNTSSRRQTVTIVVVLLIGISLGYYFVARRELSQEAAAYEYPLDTFIVNIAETGGHRFLKCTISVDFDNKAGIKEAQRKVPLLRDAIIDVLSSKTLEELEPGESRDMLRSELASAVDDLILKANVKRIFFSDFVVQ